MGIFQKLKDFGSKVVHGIRQGWDFVRDKVAPIARKVLPYASKIADVIPGGGVVKPVIHGADKLLTVMGR